MFVTRSRQNYTAITLLSSAKTGIKEMLGAMDRKNDIKVNSNTLTGQENFVTRFGRLESK